MATDDLAVVTPVTPRMMAFVAFARAFRMGLCLRINGHLGRGWPGLGRYRLKLRRERSDGNENQEQTQQQCFESRTSAVAGS